MTIPIQFIPRRNSPWQNVMPQLLGNMVMQQIGHKQRMDILDKQLQAQKQSTEVGLRQKGYRQASPAEAASGIRQPEFTFNKKEWFAPEETIDPLTSGGETVPGMYVLRRGGKAVQIIQKPERQPSQIEQYEYARQLAEAEAGPGGVDFPSPTEWWKEQRRAGAMQLGEKVDTAAAIKEATTAITQKIRNEEARTRFNQSLYGDALARIQKRTPDIKMRQLQRNPGMMEISVFNEANSMVSDYFSGQGKKTQFRPWADPPGWYDVETDQLLTPWSKNYPQRFKRNIR